MCLPDLPDFHSGLDAAACRASLVETLDMSNIFYEDENLTLTSNNGLAGITSGKKDNAYLKTGPVNPLFELYGNGKFTYAADYPLDGTLYVDDAATEPYLDGESVDYDGVLTTDGTKTELVNGTDLGDLLLYGIQQHLLSLPIVDVP